MEINPNQMATTTPEPKLNWLHDYKSSFRQLELTYRQKGFEEIKKLLGKSPLKTVGEYYSEDYLRGFKDEFITGIINEMRDNTYWISKVDNQVYVLNNAKSPEEFKEAFENLKKLF